MSPFKKLLNAAEAIEPGISKLWVMSLNLQMTTPPMDRNAASQRLLEGIDKQIELATNADQVEDRNGND